MSEDRGEREMLPLEEARRAARAAQARAGELEAPCRQIVEPAHEAFVAIDARGVIVDWNRQAEQMFGWSRSEALGRRMADTIVPPEFRAADLAGLHRLPATGGARILGRRIELAAQHRDGHVFPVELTLWATEGEELAFNAFVHDITDRRAAEETLAGLAAIMEHSEDAILGMSLEGTVLSWNRGAELMYGYTADEAIGGPVSVIVPPERLEELFGFLERVRRGERVPHHETVRVAKSGARVEVAESISAIRNGPGLPVGASAITRDVTEQRWLASTLDATLVALEAALDEARASEARMRRFLADAAHQLRAPIASIQAGFETLLLGLPAEERDHLLVGLGTETSRAARLVTGLLRMARLDQGIPLVPGPCDLVALCAEEAERLQAQAPRLEVVLVVGDVPDDKPALDATAVREILGNLLDNARRHAQGRVELIVAGAGAHVEVRVRDDGPGLPEGMVERAFDRFVSLDGMRGSGLGLPIARGLAEAHGGELTYEDGAFVLRLPAKPDSAASGDHRA